MTAKPACNIGPHLRELVVTIGPHHDKPWWWDNIRFDPDRCRVDYKRISTGLKKSNDLRINDLITLTLRLIGVLTKAKGKYRHIFTFECDWSSILISYIQSVFGYGNIRHVILQFIMREKQGTFLSRMKYVFMKFCFSSVHMAVCSSKEEANYYTKIFDWPPGKAVFVLFHTAPEFLEKLPPPPPGETEKKFILSAGRTFRDYKTLMEAIGKTNIPTLVIAGKRNWKGLECPGNVRVLFDISLNELKQWMSACHIFVLPLQDVRISAGQSVLLHAMAQGKAVVATRTAGTSDYIEQDCTGLFVPPKDPNALHNAILRLWNDDALCDELGKNARETIFNRHLPQQYFNRIARILRQEPGPH